MLACLFVAELIGAAALSGNPVRDGPAAPAQVVAPADGFVALRVADDRTVRLLSLGGAATDRLLSRIAAGIDAAVDEVVAFWGTDWSHDIFVVAAGSDEQFHAAAGGGLASQWADIAAITVVDRVDPARRTVVGQRIVFAPGAAHEPSGATNSVGPRAFSLCGPGRHGPGCTSMAGRGGGRFRCQAQDPAARGCGVCGAVVTVGHRPDTPGPQRSLAYDRAWWFARFVAAAYGTAKLRELYLATCGVGHFDLATAAHDVLGIDAAGLLARWQRWLMG